MVMALAASTPTFDSESQLTSGGRPAGCQSGRPTRSTM
jgi:hypothetical protein